MQSQVPSVNPERMLPKIAELYADKEMMLLRSELNVLINNPPNPEWVKEHPVAKRVITDPVTGKVIKKLPVLYIPIERLQWLMKVVFGGYTVQIIDHKLIGNSVSVHVRLYFTDPLTGKADYQDGIGAAPVQMDSGSNATEFDKIKYNAIQIGLPAAKTFAEKDAITSLGRLFGSDLNRIEESEYFSLKDSLEADEINELKKELSLLIGRCENPDLTDQLVNEITEKEELGQLTIKDYKLWIRKLRRDNKKSQDLRKQLAETNQPQPEESQTETNQSQSEENQPEENQTNQEPNQ